METGAITQYIDVAQIVLYMFWAFFAGLIYYLVRESHREGYPMDSGRENGPKVQGWPVPEPKTYKMADGHTILAPDFNESLYFIFDAPARLAAARFRLGFDEKKFLFGPDGPDTTPESYSLRIFGASSTIDRT